MLSVDVDAILKEEALKNDIPLSLLKKAFNIQFEILSENMSKIDIYNEEDNYVYSLPHFGKFLPDNRIIRSVRGKRERWLQKKTKKHNKWMDELYDSQSDNREGSDEKSNNML